jgi:hypothetical protein
MQLAIQMLLGDVSEAQMCLMLTLFSSHAHAVSSMHRHSLDEEKMFEQLFAFATGGNSFGGMGIDEMGFGDQFGPDSFGYRRHLEHHG